jgi:hypothetical protein
MTARDFKGFSATTLKWIDYVLWGVSIALMAIVDWRLGLALLLYDIQRIVEMQRHHGYHDFDPWHQAVDRKIAEQSAKSKEEKPA